MSDKNKIALISTDYNKEQITAWRHQSQLQGVLCLNDVEGLCISGGYWKADPVWCEGVDWRQVCAIVLLDCDGSVNQSQIPALGVSVPPEGHELHCQGLWVTLCDFSVFAEDIPKFDNVHAKLDKCNPCEVYDALCKCLLDLALLKDDKAGVSFMDTSITFRKPNIELIEKLQTQYATKCYELRRCRRQSRFYAFPIHNRRY